MRNFVLAFGLIFFAATTAATPLRTTRIQTPMGVFFVEAQMGYHACLFIPAEGVFYHPRQERAEAQIRLWDRAERLCSDFNKVDELADKLIYTEANLNHREQAAIEVLLGWKDRTSLVAHEFGLTSRIEKIGRRFRRLQR